MDRTDHRDADANHDLPVDDISTDAETPDSLDAEAGDDGRDWEPLPPGCEFVFPADSVVCSDYDACPEGWRYCCDTRLCEAAPGFGVRGCCNDLVCGTGGEPGTYHCREVLGTAEIVVEDCSRAPCPPAKPFCCNTRTPDNACADHALWGWHCTEQ